MIEVLTFVALWCGGQGPNSHSSLSTYRSMNEVQVCRERLMKCASRRTPLDLIFPAYDTELYWCAYKEKLQ